tara:strand:+ start:1058 stop:2542 length:1485 start_codon:yes stop_codon:yes gene_type:complete
MNNLYKKLVNTIDKFKNDKSIFIYDYSTSTKISYQNFYREYKTLEDKITNLKDDNVYLLNVSNNIKSILLIIAFTLSKKKIILKEEKSSLKNFNFKEIKIPLVNVSINNNYKIFFSKIYEDRLKDKNFDILIISSGSTGKGKIVKLNLDKALINSLNMGFELGFKPNNIHLMVMPIYHVNSLFLSIFSTFLFRQKLIIDSNFSIVNFWHIVKKFKIKSTSLSPTIVKYLNLTNLKKKNSTLKKVVCASSFLLKEDYYEFYKKFKISIIQGYGLSEATNFSTIMPSNVKLRKKINSYFNTEKYITIGHSVKDNNLRILHKNKFINKEKIIGEILISGKFLYNGYFGKRKSILKYIRTGDLGFYRFYNKKKYYFITSRIKEIIKFKDHTIYPIDIENFINKYLKTTIDFFCFGLTKGNLEYIGCAIDRKNFTSGIKKKLLNMLFEKKYEYLPENFFIMDLKKFKTKTLKPKRNYLSNYINKKFKKKMLEDKFIDIK